MIDLDESTFDAFIAEDDSLIQFSAKWCTPCKMMTKTIKLCNFNNLKTGKINIDASQNIMRHYKVMSIPTVIYFKNGVEVFRAIGLKNKDKLEEFISDSKKIIENKEI